MNELAALIPSLGVALIFVLAMRALIFADRRERDAAKKFDQEANTVASAPGSESNDAKADSEASKEIAARDT